MVVFASWDFHVDLCRIHWIVRFCLSMVFYVDVSRDPSSRVVRAWVDLPCIGNRWSLWAFDPREQEHLVRHRIDDDIDAERIRVL
jgi:hypothetical protein